MSRQPVGFETAPNLETQIALHAEARPFDLEMRRYHDITTWLAEVLPGQMRTPFEYRFDGTELYASDGSPLGKIFDDSIEHAANLPPHLAFEKRRTRLEKGEYQDMIAMMQDPETNTIVVRSDLPPELMDATEDVGGYNVRRKPAMLRVLIKTPQGTLKMYSQSLDGSNRRALEDIDTHLGFQSEPGELLGQRRHLNLGPHEQEFLVDELTNVYDRSLQTQYGGEWYAGRQNGSRANTYDFVCKQVDLLTAYLATTAEFTGGTQEYNLAAAMRQRYLADEQKVIDFTPAESYRGLPVVAHAMALAEMNGAGMTARRNGEVVSGCGATIRSESNDDSAQSQLKAAGYGGNSEARSGASSSSEKLVWKDGICIIDNCPTRPGKTKVAQCSICKLCQGWFDKGKDPGTIYKPEVSNFQSIIEFNFGKKDEQNE